ncbi:MAG: hypothetical protein JXR73_04450 [Candidatus Omnitrophica bacterium]|nr:hypothetical protein [Candidatus Omnitrophota bacterium]
MMTFYRFSAYMTLFVIMAFCACIQDARTQEIYEYSPEEAFLLPNEIRSLSNVTVKLQPGVYEMEDQLYFKAGTNLIIEGSGSGLGGESTILDFTIYSESLEDSRALSVRGAVILRDLTIRNVRGRAADLRTGSIDSPSDAQVIFNNVWFVDCNTGLKSTGGRTVGVPGAPMLAQNCVFLNTPGYPYPSMDAFIDVRDTTYALFDHCDFFNTNNMVQMRIDDPDAAPNTGPEITIQNSIVYSVNGSEDDLYLLAGILTFRNCVLWDSVDSGALILLGEGTVEEIDSIVADPLYVNVSPDASDDQLDFHLQPGSPAVGLGADGYDAGSIAALPVRVNFWELLNQ